MIKYSLSLFMLLLLASVFPALGMADEENAADSIAKGRELAFDRRKGNCLACHMIEGGELAGNYGPPLVMMKARFPDRAILHAQIWDAAVRNSETRMPPYGRHRILTEDEIELVVDFILSL